jgi:CheY-like chemotaxis protein
MMCRRNGNRQQARVLVADWDQANAITLAAIMNRAGFKVAIAFDGKEAVEEAEKFRPDLFLSEAYLGRLSGIEAAVQITAALPECRVLFLSGEASIVDIIKAAPEHLVYSFTPKPIHSLDLLNAVAYMLSAEWSTGDSGAGGPDQDTPDLHAGESTALTRCLYGGEGELAAETKKDISDAMLQQHYFSAAG